MAKIGKEIAILDAKLADPSLYTGPANKATDLQTARAAAGARMAKAEQTWLDATAALETAGLDSQAA
jgi:ATP-binding cassette subfamily F protein 3